MTVVPLVPGATQQYSTNLADSAVEAAVIHTPERIHEIPCHNSSEIDDLIELKLDVNVLCFAYTYKGDFEHLFDADVLQVGDTLNVYVKDSFSAEENDPERTAYFRINLSKFIDPTITTYRVLFLSNDGESATLVGCINNT